MAYDVFVYPVNGDRNQRLDIQCWFLTHPCNYDIAFPNKFVAKEFAGELDYYAVFNKLELLKIGKDYQKLAELPSTLDEYVHQVKIGQIYESDMDKHHYKLLDYFASFQDKDTFNIEAIYWESGMF